MFDYTGKVVAITGASSGLGKQMAEGFAQQNANLVLLARRVERLEASAKEWSEKYFVDYKREDWDFTLNLDLTSVFTVSQAFVNFMKEAMAEGKQTYGRVINIASIYGIVGNTAIPTIAYHTTKGAVVNFSRGAAAELATSNITVNTICPGYFYTELTTETLNSDYFQAFANQSVPMKRYGNEGELNSVAVFLGAEESSYVTGQTIAVDGGYTCV